VQLIRPKSRSSRVNLGLGGVESIRTLSNRVCSGPSRVEPLSTELVQAQVNLNRPSTKLSWADMTPCQVESAWAYVEQSQSGLKSSQVVLVPGQVESTWTHFKMSRHGPLAKPSRPKSRLSQVESSMYGPMSSRVYPSPSLAKSTCFQVSLRISLVRG